MKALSFLCVHGLYQQRRNMVGLINDLILQIKAQTHQVAGGYKEIEVGDGQRKEIPPSVDPHAHYHLAHVPQREAGIDDLQNQLIVRSSYSFFSLNTTNSRIQANKLQTGPLTCYAA